MIFCPRVYSHICIDTNGLYKACCKAKSSRLNAKNTSILEYWNSDYLINIRNSLKNNEWPKECIKCKVQEEKGKKSHRQLKIDNTPEYKFSLDNYQSYISNNKISQPFSYDIKLGNVCNLYCIMCSPWASSLIQKRNNANYINLTLDEKKEIDRVNTINFNWYESSIFEQNLQYIKDTAYIVKFAGGEPFLISSVLDFLSNIIQENKDLKINIFTNLISINNKVLDIIKEIKNLKLSISCDGINDTYEKIRTPASWDKFNKKYQKIISYNIPHSIHFTLQKDNYMNLSDTLLYFHKYDPLFFQIQYLDKPENLKIDRLSYDERIDFHKSLNNISNEIINFLEAINLAKNYIPLLERNNNSSLE